MFPKKQLNICITCYMMILNLLYLQVHIRNSPSENSFKNICKRKNCVKTSISVFKSGRCQMVLRNLEERTWYKIQIQAMNLLGESKPCIAFFVTRSQPSDWLRYEGGRVHAGTRFKNGYQVTRMCSQVLHCGDGCYVRSCYALFGVLEL